jgi:hypothetical protein
VLANPFAQALRRETRLAANTVGSLGKFRYRCGAGAVVAATRCVWIVLAGLRKSEAAKMNITLAATTIATISSEQRFSFHAGRSAS